MKKYTFCRKLNFFRRIVTYKGKYNIIDNTNNILLPNDVDYIGFKEGKEYCRIIHEGKCNVFNLATKKIISEIWFKNIYPISKVSQGYVYRVRGFDDSVYFLKLDGKTLHFHNDLSNIQQFINGYSIVQNKDGKFNFINSELQVLSPNLWFEKVSTFSESGFACVTLLDGENLINQYGKLMFQTSAENVIFCGSRNKCDNYWRDGEFFYTHNGQLSKNLLC